MLAFVNLKSGRALKGPLHRVLKGQRLPKAEKPQRVAGEAVANGAVCSSYRLKDENALGVRLNVVFSRPH